VLRHSALALSNAAEHHRVPFRRLGRLLEAARRRIPDRAPVRAILASAALVAIAAVLGLVSAPHHVALSGRLRPVNRQALVAQETGIVTRWRAEEGPVTAGTMLIQLQNSEIESSLETIETQLQALRAWKAASQTESGSGDAARQALDRQLDALEAERKRWKGRIERLRIVSPGAGRIELIEEPQQLIGRRVERGQELLRFYVTEGGWEVDCEATAELLELFGKAHTRTGAPLSVRIEVPFTEQTVDGSFEPSQAPRAAERSASSIAIRVPAASSDDWRPGWPARVTVDCGRRAIGYVWFDRARRFVSARLLAPE
jgi:hypothetical protein